MSIYIDDFELSLGNWRETINRLAIEHGDNAQLYFDGGACNVCFYLSDVLPCQNTEDALVADFSGSLTEWRTEIESLISVHGTSIYLVPDSGANNSSAVINI